MNSSIESDLELQNTPPEIIDSAHTITENLLPRKSKDEYNKYYTHFMDWKEVKKTVSFSENVFLAYFHDLSMKWKSSTLWKTYSILKSTMNVKHDIDISKYKKVRAFLKRSSEKYSPKKSMIFTTENLKQFLEQAPDEIYLATKVALIIGVMGACRKIELYNLKITEVKDLDSAFLISIPNTKTNKPREFTITENFYNIVKKYSLLRPPNMTLDNFFVNFRGGRCTKQVIGINKLGNMPKQIANYLNLEYPELYTGHCYRRTSATVLVDAGADLTTLKRHGGWKSSEVAEGYIENSMKNRMNIANKLVSSITGSSSALNMPSTSATHTNIKSSEKHVIENSSQSISAPIFNFNNCHNTININVISK